LKHNVLVIASFRLRLLDVYTQIGYVADIDIRNMKLEMKEELMSIRECQLA